MDKIVEFLEIKSFDLTVNIILLENTHNDFLKNVNGNSMNKVRLMDNKMFTFSIGVGVIVVYICVCMYQK